jgi:hypothetical protein
MVPVYGGKCLSRKAFHNWVEKRGKRFADDEEVETEVRKWLRTVKKLLCCTFRCTGKAVGQVYRCWWRICRERNVFFYRFEYYMFYILCKFVTYLLTLPHTLEVHLPTLVLTFVWNRHLKIAALRYLNQDTIRFLPETSVSKN